MPKGIYKRKKPPLRPRHRKVLNYYYGVSNLSKTDALRRAKYAMPECYLSLFDTPAVKAEMARREARFAERFDVSYERVEREIAKIAYFNPLSILEIDEKTGWVTVDITKADAADMAAIGEIRVEEHWEGQGEAAIKVTVVKVKPWNKLKALEGLMKHGGLSRQKADPTAVDLVDRIIAARNRVGGTDGNS